MELKERNKKIGEWIKKHPIIGIGIFILAVIAGVLIVMSFSGTTPTTPNTSNTVANQKVELGDEAILNFNDDIKNCEQSAVVATSEENLKSITKIMLSNDDYGLAQAISSGSAFLVGNCTKVKVIDSATGSRQIRILAGDQIGKAGWVPFEFLKK